MKYLISGYIGFDNFGDEAIAHILTSNLKKNGAEKVTLISSNPKKTSKIHEVASCSMLGFLPALLESDTLISGGGSLLQDVTSFKSLIYYLLVIYTALFLGKKVEIYAQGIGPINSKIGQFLTKTALKKAYKISVRDINSKNLLEKWGIMSELVNDPVLDIELPQKHKTGIVGIQLRNFNSIDDIFIEKLSKKVAEKFHNKKIKVISLQDSIDKDICKKFTEHLKNIGVTNVQLETGLDIQNVFDTISDLEYLISMRFHATVLGIKSDVKTVAINYDPKIKSLAETYNIPILELKNTDFSPLEKL